MTSLLRSLEERERAHVLSPRVGVEFELGTVAYRASVYAWAIVRGVPPGTPCVVSDDPSVWRGAAAVSSTHPMVGVLHGDDEAYYSLARQYRAELSRCIAVSRRIAETAAERGAAQNIAVIPCGIPVEACGRTTSARATAKLVWIGRMEEEFKRVSDLALIADALRAREIDFELAIVGDGSAEPALRRSLSERGLGASVHLLGWREASEIRQLLCESDVLLLPSNREGMPVVMMEALAAGCAVVASRVSGVEDAVMAPMAEGVLFAHAVGDVEGAADFVRRALMKPAPERRAAARRFAEEIFSIGACVDGYEAVLGGLQASALPTTRKAHGSLLTSAISLPLATARSARRALRRRWSSA
jgi:glycosyltransferase involved in cell wall biosynthesis